MAFLLGLAARCTAVRRNAAPPLTHADLNLAKWLMDLATPRIWSVSSRVGPSTRARGLFGLALSSPCSSASFRCLTCTITHAQSSAAINCSGKCGKLIRGHYTTAAQQECLQCRSTRGGAGIAPQAAGMPMSSQSQYARPVGRPLPEESPLQPHSAGSEWYQINEGLLVPELVYGNCFSCHPVLLFYRYDSGKPVLESRIVDKLYTCISVGVWRLCSARNASSSSPKPN